VAKKTDHFGHDQGAPSSDAVLSPVNPQTGDGRTTREIHDQPKVEMRDQHGRPAK
jgi:hypothetical protein